MSFGYPRLVSKPRVSAQAQLVNGWRSWQVTAVFKVAPEMEVVQVWYTLDWEQAIDRALDLGRILG